MYICVCFYLFAGIIHWKHQTLQFVNIKYLSIYLGLQFLSMFLIFIAKVPHLFPTFLLQVCQSLIDFCQSVLEFFKFTLCSFSVDVFEFSIYTIMNNSISSSPVLMYFIFCPCLLTCVGFYSVQCWAEVMQVGIHCSFQSQGQTFKILH